jgi:hypothetical protein
MAAFQPDVPVSSRLSGVPRTIPSSESRKVQGTRICSTCSYSAKLGQRAVGICGSLESLGRSSYLSRDTTNLVSAAQRGNEAEVRLLLSKGANVDLKYPSGVPAL